MKNKIDVLIQEPETNTGDLCETKKIRETEDRGHAQALQHRQLKLLLVSSFTNLLIYIAFTYLLPTLTLEKAHILPIEVALRQVLHDEDAPEFPCTPVGLSSPLVINGDLQHLLQAAANTYCMVCKAACRTPQTG